MVIEAKYDREMIQKLFPNHSLNEKQFQWMEWFMHLMGYEPVYSQEVMDDQSFHEFISKECDHIIIGAQEQVSSLEAKQYEIFK